MLSDIQTSWAQIVRHADRGVVHDSIVSHNGNQPFYLNQDKFIFRWAIHSAIHVRDFRVLYSYDYRLFWIDDALYLSLESPEFANVPAYRDQRPGQWIPPDSIMAEIQFGAQPSYTLAVASYVAFDGSLQILKAESPDFPSDTRLKSIRLAYSEKAMKEVQQALLATDELIAAEALYNYLNNKKDYEGVEMSDALLMAYWQITGSISNYFLLNAPGEIPLFPENEPVNLTQSLENMNRLKRRWTTLLSDSLPFTLMSNAETVESFILSMEMLKDYAGFDYLDQPSIDRALFFGPDANELNDLLAYYPLKEGFGRMLTDGLLEKSKELINEGAFAEAIQWLQLTASYANILNIDVEKRIGQLTQESVSGLLYSYTRIAIRLISVRGMQSADTYLDQMLAFVETYSVAGPDVSWVAQTLENAELKFIGAVAPAVQDQQTKIFEIYAFEAYLSKLGQIPSEEFTSVKNEIIQIQYDYFEGKLKAAYQDSLLDSFEYWYEQSKALMAAEPVVLSGKTGIQDFLYEIQNPLTSAYIEQAVILQQRFQVAEAFEQVRKAREIIQIYDLSISPVDFEKMCFVAALWVKEQYKYLGFLKWAGKHTEAEVLQIEIDDVAKYYKLDTNSEIRSYKQQLNWEERSTQCADWAYQVKQLYLDAKHEASNQRYSEAVNHLNIILDSSDVLPCNISTGEANNLKLLYQYAMDYQSMKRGLADETQPDSLLKHLEEMHLFFAEHSVFKAGLEEYKVEQLLDERYQPELSLRAAEWAFSSGSGHMSFQYLLIAIDQGLKISRTAELQKNLGLWYAKNLSANLPRALTHDQLMHIADAYHLQSFKKAYLAATEN